MRGRFRPLRERSSPPTATVQYTSLPSTRSTRSCTNPSFRNRRSPGFTTLGSGSKLMDTRRVLPVIFSLVRLKESPETTWIGSGSIVPSLIFGPGRSPMIATRRPAALEAVRIRATTSACWSNVPCEKFSRATFMPARMRPSSISGEFDAGPMVATILVL